MIRRIPNPLRPRPQGDVTHHVDELTLASLLRGAEVPAADTVAAHLSACATCRHRMETADPLLALFEEAPAAVRVPAIPMPGTARLVPRPHWQLSAGVAVAAAAALALAVAHQPTGGSSPGVQAQTLSDVQRVTAMIRTAEQNHDTVALHNALVEAQKTLAKVDAAQAADPRLTADLASLGQAVASLPSDPATAGLTADVESMIAAAPADTANPQPSPAGTDDAVAAPVGTATPEPTVEPTPDPTADATPGPTPDPTPDATPTPTDGAVPTVTDPTPPF